MVCCTPSLLAVFCLLCYLRRSLSQVACVNVFHSHCFATDPSVMKNHFIVLKLLCLKCDASLSLTLSYLVNHTPSIGFLIIRSGLKGVEYLGIGILESHLKGLKKQRRLKQKNCMTLKTDSRGIAVSPHWSA